MPLKFPIDLKDEVTEGEKFEFVLSHRDTFMSDFVDFLVPEFAVKKVVLNDFRSDHFEVEKIWKNEETQNYHIVAKSTKAGTGLGIVFGVLIISAGVGGALWVLGLQLDKVYKIIETPIGAIGTAGATGLGLFFAFKALKGRK